ncbi:MAG: polymorphic toxin-type HINT domain-containing protein [Bacteroidota bacterium]
MNQAIKCYTRVCSLLFAFLLLGMGQLHAQSTRSLQWAATNGSTTVSIDELCPATEGYVEFTPKSRLMIGLTDKSNPVNYRDMDYCVYPYQFSTFTNLYFYKDGAYQGYTRINQTLQASDKIKIERKGSLIKFYFNTTLAKTYELDPNNFYRVFAVNYGSHNISTTNTISTHSLIEPCSNYNPGSSYLLPPATTNENHNWVHNKIFNQHGDIVGETRVYLDRLGSAVQTQTKNYASNEVIGKQLVYDAQGRNAVISMEAPTGDNKIEYQAKFLRSLSSNLAFDYSDFDTPAKTNNPSKVKDVAGSVGRYYGQYSEPYVPSTEYPFSQIEFHTDGSVRRVAQVGEHYRMGTGHETQYYNVISGGELAYLYGYRKSYQVDVPSANPLNPIPQDIGENILAYKTITIGTDGIEHISFTNMEGQLLATAVSGEPGGSDCSNQRARHELEYRGSQSTKIHLPAATKQTMRIGYGGYLVNTNPLNFISIKITDLKDDQILTQGTDYTITQGTGLFLDVSFLGTHANTSGYYKVAFDYTAAYLEEYYEFYIPGYEPPVIIEYELDYSNWAINYYDDRGRRIQSIQPKGTRCDFVDVSQMGTFPFFKSFDLVTGAPAVYSTSSATIRTLQLSTLQTGLGQEASMTVKTMLKPGIIADHWYPDDDIVIYEPITDPIQVGVIENPFTTSTNPTGEIMLTRLTEQEFDALYPNVAVSHIDAGNAAAFPAPVTAQARAADIPDDEIPISCFNGFQDYGELGIDCGGRCPECEECEEDPEFFVSFQFEVRWQGILQNNGVVNIGSDVIHRTFGLNCNNTLIDLTDPEEEQIEMSRFFSNEEIANYNFKSIRAKLYQTRAKTDPNANYGTFDVANQAHRYVRYVYLRLDGVHDVFFDSPIPHEMAETVVYDDLNRVVAMNDPDRGLVEFLHDEEGKLRFSQDARQWTNGYFTYYSYDARGRIIENGEYRSSSHYFPTTLRPISAIGTNVYNIRNQLDGLPSSNRADQSYYAYDEPASNFPSTASTDYASKFVEGRLAMSKNGEHTTWYKYNHNGQLVAALQEYPEVGLKTMDYEYDCFGRLTESAYQKNLSSESFTHLYSYDINGDLRTIETKKGTELPKLHSAYDFYKLGQLKRTELGESLQGIDYTYTVDGALKAINHPSLNSYDPGKDGYTGTNVDFAKDAFGMAIDYHTADYVRKGTNFNYGKDEASNDQTDGRIKSLRWKTRDGVITPYGQQHMFTYQYDWKQQLNSATYGFYTPNNVVNNGSGSGAYNSPGFGTFATNPSAAFQVQNISYDANGNILSLHRKDDDGENMDNLSYVYEHPDFNASGGYTAATNKLRYVTDAAGFLDKGDVQNQVLNNYSYNANGEIESDQEKDISLVYNSFGKLDEIRSYDGSRLVMSFTYDEHGDRIGKTTYNAGGYPEKSTLYVREPGGIVIATYEKEYTEGGTTFGLEEYMLDGGQLGIFYPSGNQYVYHMTDHLGNVRATINRNKDASGEVQTMSYADYYPFGMVMPGHEQASSPRYRLGYQGQELDAKVGLYAFQLRMYDPRLGKWLSPDPYDQHWSPYLAMSNNPISFIDPDGGEDDPYDQHWRIQHYMNTGNLQALENYLWSQAQFSDGGDPTLNAAIMDYNNYMAAIEWWRSHTSDVVPVIQDGQLGVHVQIEGRVLIGERQGANGPIIIRKDEIYGLAVSKFFAVGSELGFTNESGLFAAPPKQVETPQPKKSRWSRALDWVQTGLDVVGLVPGLGEVADGLNAVIYLGRGDYTNAALSVAAMNPVGGQAATALKYVNKSGLLDDAAGAVIKRVKKGKKGKPGCDCPMNTKCFIAGTPILTQNGNVPIEQIAVGDSVWAYDEVIKRRELKAVINVFQKDAEEIVRLSIGDQEIAVTAEHPFFSEGYWREAGQLVVGDTVLLFDGTSKIVSAVRIEQGDFKVYNFEVADLHSYYVADASVLVHNSGCDVEKLRTGGNDTAVNVKTKAEADALLKEAFPDYQKVNGVGPQEPKGIRKKRKMERFKKGGAYHKDYHIDPATGRVKGHRADNVHGNYPHINIKRKDGKKVIINITGD